MATVALEFATEDEAQLARYKSALNMHHWEIGKKHPNVLVCGPISSMQFDALKSLLKEFDLRIKPCDWKHCKDHCAGQEIDGTPHSVDVGPDFEVEIPVENPNQLTIF